MGGSEYSNNDVSLIDDKKQSQSINMDTPGSNEDNILRAK